MALVRLYVTDRGVSGWLVQHRKAMGRMTLTGNTGDMTLGSVTWGTAPGSYATMSTNTVSALTTNLTYPTWKEQAEPLGWNGEPRKWLPRWL